MNVIRLKQINDVPETIETSENLSSELLKDIEYLDKIDMNYVFRKYNYLKYEIKGTSLNHFSKFLLKIDNYFRKNNIKFNV